MQPQLTPTQTNISLPLVFWFWHRAVAISLLAQTTLKGLFKLKCIQIDELRSPDLLYANTNMNGSFCKRC